MKEIKFRSWDDKTKSFSYFYISEKGREVKDWAEKRNKKFDWRNAQQFTGAYDRNGKEIYEGDIVRFGTSRQQHEVVFRKYGFQITAIEEGLTLDKHYFIGNTQVESIEVIGNIYEGVEK